VDARRAVKIGAPVVWFALSAAMVAAFGLPTSRLFVFAWVGAGMATVAITDLPRKVPRFVLEWSPFMGVLVLYDRLRGYADGALIHVRALPQIRLEAALFGKPIPTVWLQSHLWHGAYDLRWWDYAAWFVYITYFFSTLLVAAVIWTWAHQHFARFATMVCALALAGFATYVLYPADPPWLAAREGLIGQANRTVKVVGPHVPIAQFDSIFNTGEKYSNNVAAMPSLHAAYSMLLVLFLWRFVPRWTRPLLAMYPPAMAFALVYGGEHFVVDCIAGWIYAGVTFVVVERAFARRAERHARFEPVLVD
jgi:membrane-associated phospholipid phosphatase